MSSNHLLHSVDESTEEKRAAALNVAGYDAIFASPWDQATHVTLPQLQPSEATRSSSRASGVASVVDVSASEGTSSDEVELYREFLVGALRTRVEASAGLGNNTQDFTLVPTKAPTSKVSNDTSSSGVSSPKPVGDGAVSIALTPASVGSNAPHATTPNPTVQDLPTSAADSSGSSSGGNVFAPSASSVGGNRASVWTRCKSFVSFFGFTACLIALLAIAVAFRGKSVTSFASHLTLTTTNEPGFLSFKLTKAVDASNVVPTAPDATKSSAGKGARIDVAVTLLMLPLLAIWVILWTMERERVQLHAAMKREIQRDINNITQAAIAFCEDAQAWENSQHQLLIAQRSIRDEQSRAPEDTQDRDEFHDAIEVDQDEGALQVNNFLQAAAASPQTAGSTPHSQSAPMMAGTPLTTVVTSMEPPAVSPQATVATPTLTRVPPAVAIEPVQPPAVSSSHSATAPRVLNQSTPFMSGAPLSPTAVAPMQPVAACPLTTMATPVLPALAMAATPPSNFVAPLQALVAAAPALTQGAPIMPGTPSSPTADTPMQPVAVSPHAGMGMQLASGSTSPWTGMPLNPVLSLTDEQKRNYSKMQFRRAEGLHRHLRSYCQVDFLPAEDHVFYSPDSFDGHAKLIPPSEEGQCELYRATFYFGDSGDKVVLGDFPVYRQALLALQMAREYIRDNNIAFATDCDQVSTGWRSRIAIQREGDTSKQLMEISDTLPSLRHAGLTVLVMKDWLLHLLQQGVREESLSDETIKKMFREVVKAVYDICELE